LASDGSVYLRIPAEETTRLALLAELLTAWQSLATEVGDGPAPPVTVSEARARYGGARRD
jgi:hypothetical protein